MPYGVLVQVQSRAPIIKDRQVFFVNNSIAKTLANSFLEGYNKHKYIGG